MLSKQILLLSFGKRLCQTSQILSCGQTRQIQNYVAVNEPILKYEEGSDEKKALAQTLEKYKGKTEDIPIVIGDEEIRTKEVKFQVEPFDHHEKIAKYHYATPDLVQKAIDNSLKARKAWDRTPLEKRCDVFLKAADLMANKYRMDLMASTMMGQV